MVSLCECDLFFGVFELFRPVIAEVPSVPEEWMEVHARV
jgi:hypothetical protein